jgi:aldose 1-epimerase
MKITSQPFGETADGNAVHLFSLSNDHGMEVNVTNYGGIITALWVPDRWGKIDDVVLGHDTLEGYLHRSRYFGALIGRYANRISRGQFSLNGTRYSLTQNNGENHLHGGFRGFDKVVWEAREIIESDGVGLELSYLSQEGEEGYPGNLRVVVTYRLTEENELRLDYFATTDKETIVNLTNHSYFNLAGGGTVLSHELTINADRFVAVREGLIPTGEIKQVKDTPMDFTHATQVGARIKVKDDQLIVAGGYDHNFVLRTNGNRLHQAAKIHEPTTGRVLEVLTDQPGLQFYSGNFLDGTIVGKNGRAYVKYSGCCLEPQHFPDAPNQPSFPSTLLKPEERCQQTTILRFSVS